MRSKTVSCNGCQYLYSVKAPVRATLSIHFNGICWEPGELRLACNKPVPDSVRATVFADLFQSAPCASPADFPGPDDSPEDTLLTEEDDDDLPLWKYAKSEF